jgi:hypothetical protein
MLGFFFSRLQHKASNSQIWICFGKLMSLWCLMNHNLTILGLHFSILMQVQLIIKYIIGRKEASPSNFKLWFEPCEFVANWWTKNGSKCIYCLLDWFVHFDMTKILTLGINHLKTKRNLVHINQCFCNYLV